MPTIGNPISGSDKPCSRCNSKRKVSKKWTEKIQNTTGFMVLEHTEYKCTNKECQEAFEKEMLAEEQKRERLKQVKQEDAAKRAPVK